MNQLQRDILYWLRESNKERETSVSQILRREKGEAKVKVELGILREQPYRG
ncbi:hypothetical protein [Peribacillus frigoritolerans]|uniref:hypothetical protein n=1 Tax=Peribacillus frigoritolerans TaxID=450367 RepID=UPI003F7EE908